MRISDWSSDVCSSDLNLKRRARAAKQPVHFSRINRRPTLPDPRGGEILYRQIRLRSMKKSRRALRIDHSNDALRLSERRVGSPLPSRSEEHTSELQYLMRISYAVFCLTKNISS